MDAQPHCYWFRLVKNRCPKCNAFLRGSAGGNGIIVCSKAARGRCDFSVKESRMAEICSSIMGRQLRRPPAGKDTKSIRSQQ